MKEESSLVLKCGYTKDLCCHLFFFVVMADIVSELAIGGVLSDFLHINDLVLISEVVRSMNKIKKWKKRF